MGSIYTEKIRLRSGRCDMYGSWKPSAILETMQETAGEHSEIFGLGRREMARLNLGWIISRLKVEFSRMPVSGEEITAETFPTPNRHLFFPRTHIFKDAEGQVIGAANTLWMVMDLSERKVVSSEEILAGMPDYSDMKPALGMPAAVKPCGADPVTASVAPQFTDLDSNGHANNTKYMDWCCNALGIETMKDNIIISFDVNYDAEILPGAEVRTELTREGDRFAFFGYSGDKRHFSIGGRLCPRG